MTREWPSAGATLPGLPGQQSIRCPDVFGRSEGQSRVLAFAGRAAAGEGEVEEWAKLLSAGQLGWSGSKLGTCVV